MTLATIFALAAVLAIGSATRSWVVMGLAALVAGIFRWRIDRHLRALDEVTIPPAPQSVWAAYDGYSGPFGYQATHLVLFASEPEAAEYAAARGVWLAEIPHGQRVEAVLERAHRAPRAPDPDVPP